MVPLGGARIRVLLSMLGLVASLKLLHLSVNLLNALAFPLVLAIGVIRHSISSVSRREGVCARTWLSLEAATHLRLATFAGFAVLIPPKSGVGVALEQYARWASSGVC